MEDLIRILDLPRLADKSKTGGKSR